MIKWYKDLLDCNNTLKSILIDDFLDSQDFSFSDDFKKMLQYLKDEYKNSRGKIGIHITGNTDPKCIFYDDPKHNTHSGLKLTGHNSSGVKSNGDDLNLNINFADTFAKLLLQLKMGCRYKTSDDRKGHILVVCIPDSKRKNKLAIHDINGDRYLDTKYILPTYFTSTITEKNGKRVIHFDVENINDRHKDNANNVPEI